MGIDEVRAEGLKEDSGREVLSVESRSEASSSSYAAEERSSDRSSSSLWTSLSPNVVRLLVIPERRDIRLNLRNSSVCLRISRSRVWFIVKREELLISRSRTLRSRRAEAARSFRCSSLDFPGEGSEGFVGDCGWEEPKEGALGSGEEIDAGDSWSPDKGEPWLFLGVVLLRSVGEEFL